MKASDNRRFCRKVVTALWADVIMAVLVQQG